MKMPAMVCNLCGSQLHVTIPGLSDGLGVIIQHPTAGGQPVLTSSPVLDADWHLCGRCLPALRDFLAGIH